MLRRAVWPLTLSSPPPHDYYLVVGGYGSETSSAIVPRRIGLRDNDPPGMGADGCSATQAFALASLGCGGYRTLKKRPTSIRFRKPQHRHPDRQPQHAEDAQRTAVDDPNAVGHWFRHIQRRIGDVVGREQRHDPSSLPSAGLVSKRPT